MNIFLPSAKEDRYQSEERLQSLVNSLNKMTTGVTESEKIQNKIKQIINEITYLRKYHPESLFVNLRTTTFGFLIVEDFPELKEYL